MAGTDSGLDWALGVYLVAVGSVATATAWRILVPPARGAPRQARRVQPAPAGGDGTAAL
jgi:hypothetical protein